MVIVRIQWRLWGSERQKPWLGCESGDGERERAIGIVMGTIEARKSILQVHSASSLVHSLCYRSSQYICSEIPFQLYLFVLVCQNEILFNCEMIWNCLQMYRCPDHGQTPAFISTKLQCVNKMKVYVCVSVCIPCCLMSKGSHLNPCLHHLQCERRTE